MENNEKEVAKYINEDGRIVSFPSKKHRAVRPYLYNYLINKFDANVIYTEKEVNEIIKAWCLFEDYVLIRRELIESFFFETNK